MGGVVDDCGLRFVQMCRRPPQNYPDFGVQRIFRNITEKGPLPKSYQIDELTSQTLQSHVLYTYLPSAFKNFPLKRPRGAGEAEIGLVGPLRTFFSYIDKKRNHQPPARF